jgi:hypothetical protein
MNCTAKGTIKFDPSTSHLWVPSQMKLSALGQHPLRPDRGSLGLPTAAKTIFRLAFLGIDTNIRGSYMDSDASQTGGMIGLLAWLEVHKRQVAIGAGAFLVVACLAMIVIQRQAQKEKSASESLSDVRIPFSSAVAPPPGAVEALSKVAVDHAGTKAAARALLIGAGILFTEAKSATDYAEAQKRFTRVTQEYPESPWQPQAHLGIAAALVAQGKTAEAIAKYEEINRRYASSPIIDEARLALARLYESSKPEDAFKLYEDLTKGNPGSVISMEANMRQDALLKAHPELAKLKEPVNPPVTPVTPASQQIQVTPSTNRVAAGVSNVANRVTTNVQRATLTNRPGTSQPVPIKLSPTPAPGAANPTPPK